MPEMRDEAKLLHAMGFETANIHLGTPASTRAIVRDLSTRPRHWLHRASAAMVGATTEDWREWRRRLAKPKQ
jgi:hypothetical protein